MIFMVCCKKSSIILLNPPKKEGEEDNGFSEKGNTESSLKEYDVLNEQMKTVSSYRSVFLSLFGRKLRIVNDCKGSKIFRYSQILYEYLQKNQ